MKIVFFGASRFVLPVIEMLHQNFELALVVTTEQKLTDAVPAYCLSNNISYISVSKFDQHTMARLGAIQANVAILASFGFLLPAEVLDIFPKGILNIHPSLLALYRGSIPVQTALLNGDRETGVTIIKLDDQMDHGPILSQEKETIRETDTTDSLQERLFKKGAEILVKVLPEYLSGKIQLRDQNDKAASYTKRLLTRQDGYIDSDNPPSPEQLDRMIRAYYPWPAVWTRVKTQEKELRIKLLQGNKIQVEGGRPMGVRDFINGYPQLKEKIEALLQTKN